MKIEGRCNGCFSEIGNVSACPHCNSMEGVYKTSPLHLPAGTILENKYVLGSALGQGGFGITYLAWDLNLNIKLAIKEYFPQDLATREEGHTEISAYSGSMGSDYEYGLEKFLQEARTLAQFAGHPNVVSVRDFFRANGTAYFVMYYVEGITLKDYLKESGGFLPAAEAKRLIIPILDALQEVHTAGILHRDISPDNIFINRKGQVILLDFGAARQAVSEKGLNLTVILKPGYAPEEQYRSKGEQGPWTDVYATGATMYHLITGGRPPEALERLNEDLMPAPSQMGLEIDQSLEKALLKALALDASDRFRTTAEFRDALLSGETIEAFTAKHYSPVTVAENQGSTVLHDSNTAERMVSSTPLPARPPLSPTRLLVLIGLPVIVLALLAAISAGLIEIKWPWPSSETITIIGVDGQELAVISGTIYFNEGEYNGQLHDNLPYGEGTWVHSEGSRYEGSWVEGKASGFGAMTWTNGDRYEGEWDLDMLNGTGIYYSSDGSVYDGEWFNDMRHGQGSFTSSTGSTFIGEWRADLFNGQGEHTWPDGRRYSGDFTANMRDGKGEMNWPDGTRYVGEWRADLMHGSGILYLPGGDRYEGEFAEDKFNGLGTFYFSSGEETTGIWEDGDYVAER